jgi:hypothetical protein
MRSILITLWVAAGIMLHYQCSAQGTPSAQDTAFETRVAKSDLIIEGVVKSTETFMDDQHHSIYTSACIMVTKIFKGTVADSLVEFVFMGGYYKGGWDMPSHGVGVGVGDEGLFILSTNTGPRLVKRLASYITLNRWNCILYHDRVHGLVAHHFAVGEGGLTFDDIEHDLFQRIESVTGQKKKSVQSKYI